MRIHIICTILLLSSVLFFQSCESKTRFSKVGDFFLENYDVDISSYHSIVVLSSAGDCIKCNNSFSKEMAKFINSSNLFLVCERGNNIDISGYLVPQANILFDYSNKFADLKITEGSAIIVLGENEIDTIITVNVESKLDCISFFKSQLF